MKESGPVAFLMLYSSYDRTAHLNKFMAVQFIQSSV